MASITTRPRSWDPLMPRASLGSRGEIKFWLIKISGTTTRTLLTGGKALAGARDSLLAVPVWTGLLSCREPVLAAPDSGDACEIEAFGESTAGRGINAGEGEFEVTAAVGSDAEAGCWAP